MEFTQGQHTSDDRAIIDIAVSGRGAQNELDASTSITKSIALPEQLHLHNQVVTHHPGAGLNPLVDAAGYIFTIIGKLQEMGSCTYLAKLQDELIQEVNTFQDSIKHHGYNTEYTLVCRYIICAMLDETISHTSWGGEMKWDAYSLLSAFNQDTQHGEKFFSIIDRAVKEPAYYIDLMELVYLCLSMGYRGRYRGSDQSQYQLEQITNALYKHIRAHRGNFSKALSPAPARQPKTTKTETPKDTYSPVSIFLFTACFIMVLFIGLGYLMELISNEAYNSVTEIQAATTKHPSKQ